MNNRTDMTFKLNLGVAFQHIKGPLIRTFLPLNEVRRYTQNLSVHDYFMAPSKSCSHDKTDKN